MSSSAAEEEGSETVETNYLTFTLPDRLGAVVTYGITYGDDPLLDVTLSVPGDGPGGDAAYLANLVLFPEGDDVSLIAGGRVLGTMTDGKQTGTLMLLVPTDVECMPSAQADYDAISARDYTVVQSVVFLFALLVLAVNLLTDIVYSFLDPRVEF